MILLVLALGCGLVASIGINQVLAKRSDAPGVEGEKVPIFVALKDIAYGDPIVPEMVKLKPVPAEDVPPEAITDFKELENRRAAQKIVAGDPITGRKLLKKGESGGSRTDQIPDGYRAIPVRVDAASGGAGLILPGDRVDLMVHMPENPTRGVRKTVTLTFLQNVKVFAVDDMVSTEQNAAQSVQAKTISLLVTPEQAQLVILASELGNIRLVMRRAGDESQLETPVATLDRLLNPNGSDAMQEESTGEEPPQSNTDLLNLLNQEREHAEAPEPPKPAGWRMTLIDGAEVRELELAAGSRIAVQVGGAAPSGGSVLPETPGGPDLEPADETEDQGSFNKEE